MKKPKRCKLCGSLKVFPKKHYCDRCREISSKARTIRRKESDIEKGERAFRKRRKWKDLSEEEKAKITEATMRWRRSNPEAYKEMSRKTQKRTYYLRKMRWSSYGATKKLDLMNKLTNKLLNQDGI